jgi:dipeptidyl aminopeptidase/acylaminoacyl peptidase
VLQVAFDLRADGSIYVHPGAPRNLTALSGAQNANPVFSPDGRKLAFLAMARPGYESDRYGIMVQNWPEGTPQEIAPQWTLSPAEGMVWTADSTALLATADDHGHHSIYRFEVSTTCGSTTCTPQLLRRNGAAASLSPCNHAQQEVAFIHSSLKEADDIYVLSGKDGSGLRRLTTIQEKFLAQFQFGEPEHMVFPGWNREPVHCWVVQPPNMDKSKRYPVVLLIHGGPQGSYHNIFHKRWNAQLFAARGYGVLLPDFHGSTGYGQAFTDSIRNDWAGKPVEDVMLALDEAALRYPWLEVRENCAAAGGSYGGFMVNILAGRYPHRFRALVSHSGNLDERFAYYATEELYFPEWERQASAIDNPAPYEKDSPLLHVKEWRTPTLVTHGARDYRVVLDQGLASFTALQRLGVPSRLLVFPDEGHWILKPQNSLLWYETVIDWLDRYCKKATPSAELLPPKVL